MMSESMVERVASVFRRANESGAQFAYEDVARAAMEAMRPTESHPDDPEWVGENARIINDWINAALNPQTSP